MYIKYFFPVLYMAVPTSIGAANPHKESNEIFDQFTSSVGSKTQFLPIMFFTFLILFAGRLVITFTKCDKNETEVHVS